MIDCLHKSVSSIYATEASKDVDINRESRRKLKDLRAQRESVMVERMRREDSEPEKLLKLEFTLPKKSLVGSESSKFSSEK